MKERKRKCKSWPIKFGLKFLKIFSKAKHASHTPHIHLDIFLRPLTIFGWSATIIYYLIKLQKFLLKHVRIEMTFIKNVMTLLFSIVRTKEKIYLKKQIICQTYLINI